MKDSENTAGRDSLETMTPGDLRKLRMADHRIKAFMVYALIGAAAVPLFGTLDKNQALGIQIGTSWGSQEPEAPRDLRFAHSWPACVSRPTVHSGATWYSGVCWVHGAFWAAVAIGLDVRMTWGRILGIVVSSLMVLLSCLRATDFMVHLDQFQVQNLGICLLPGSMGLLGLVGLLRGKPLFGRDPVPSDLLEEQGERRANPPLDPGGAPVSAEGGSASDSRSTEDRFIAAAAMSCKKCGAPVNPESGEGVVSDEAEPWSLSCAGCGEKVEPEA